MGDITENFSRKEFACPHCQIEPDWDRIYLLARASQKFRYVISGYLGKDTPLFINSGFRCEEYNRKLYEEMGVPVNDGSMHPLSLAEDIRKVIGISTKQMGKLAELVPDFSRGGIGIYPWGIHVDMRWIIGKKKSRW